MTLIILFAFISGIVTILSPCILPVLPIILSGSFGSGENQGKAKPVGIILGFVFSFTLFTLLLSSIVRVSGISADALRFVSIFVIFVFGVTMLIPQFQILLEQLFSRLSALTPNAGKKDGLFGGVLLGLSLGLLWSPCVGPILASVITLAVTGRAGIESLLITFAYSLGTAIPMFLIMIGGQKLMSKFSFIKQNTGMIQKAFGILMILTALAIGTNFDRRFQTFIIENFPKYGAGLTSFENRPAIKQQLNKIFNRGEPSILNQDESVETELETSVLPKYARAPEIVAGGEWLNSQPLKLQELQGKVVLIDFWTYSCINCQRTIPYLRNWWSKYKDKGLVIIGVHTPEFEFEKSVKNVEQAAKDFGIEYPIMQDNNFGTWRVYENQYWPAKYLIDKNGYIRYYHFGEGNYVETELAIQTLLKDAGAEGLSKDLMTTTYDVKSGTPETYIGFERNNFFTSPESIAQNTFKKYTKPANLAINKFALEGEWEIHGEYAEPKPGSSLYINFSALEAYLVMQPTEGTAQARVKVYVDGQLQYFGEDNKDGIVTVDSARLYKLVKLAKPSRHILRLEFIDGKVEVFAFTFG
jgi:cytochrome c biogenesis protein CcdA/thiol-disulfide isomerase/thioredoxin